MVRTRIAPSPTGEDLHIGNIYTALINWTVAQQNHGQFIIRIEDTDRERYIEGAESKILSSIDAFGLDYDEGPDKGGPYAPYRQSERLALYQKYAQELIAKGQAYYCFCSKEKLESIRKQSNQEKKLIRHQTICENGNALERVKKESYVIRLQVPEHQTIVFKDFIRGEITIQSDILDDQVLLKSDGFPTYHMGVVVDDYLMKITHVIRAEEWISSTPKHVLLYQALGWELPVFAHVPILRNLDKSKLSKRKNPVWASWFLQQGYLPEAILNFLALMGWSHPQEKEIFSLEEFIRVFNLKDMQPVGPVFDLKKLEWMNGQYIMKLRDDDLANKIYEFYDSKYPKEVIFRTTPLIKERIKKISDYLPLCEFFFETPKQYEIDLASQKELLRKIHAALMTIDTWQADVVGEKLLEVTKQEGVKNSEFFMILRVAITGKKISPPLNESMELLGQGKSLKRLKDLV